VTSDPPARGYSESFDSFASQLTRHYHRGFAFYVAFPQSSIRPLGLPIYIARVLAAPLKLARVPACSPLPVAAIPSMSLIPSAPFASRRCDKRVMKSQATCPFDSAQGSPLPLRRTPNSDKPRADTQRRHSRKWDACATFEVRADHNLPL
jgi:hypothetical protein